MLILTILIILLYICLLFLFFYIRHKNKQIIQKHLETNETVNSSLNEHITNINYLYKDVNNINEQITTLESYKNDIDVQYKDSLQNLNNKITELKTNILLDISSYKLSYANYIKDISSLYKENLINLEKYYKELNTKIVNDVSIIYKKMDLQNYIENTSLMLFTSDILHYYDTSLEDYQIYVLNELQSLKTRLNDKFVYLDHVIETYNSDIQRLTNFLNDVKIDVLYIKTDINTFKLDSINLHKLDISLYKIENDINDLKYKIKDLNELLINNNIQKTYDDNILNPEDIILDVSVIDLSEQYKEISKYTKKHAITEDDNGTNMNFKSKK